MKCPYCAEDATKVVDTRETTANEIRRRRECSNCGERFTTYERIESPELKVVKEDGTEEDFDRSKLRSGIERACNKRPVSDEQIEDLIDQVESEIRAENRKEVESKHIGELVMEKLRDIDDVAYIRFASVYRDFDSADSFEEEIEELK
ncbi:MAG: transcriptional regulator NrdR [Candidatus Nanohaloarchaea archaeon]|nr:transcriptional regulator NrdR [Candidatus Nanohaloarchaea archaeon]